MMLYRGINVILSGRNTQTLSISKNVTIHMWRNIVTSLTNKQKEHFKYREVTTDTDSPTVKEILEKWKCRFENECIPEPVESIEHIVAHVMGLKKLLSVTNSQGNRLSTSQLEKLETLCECRLSRMPVQYIIGEWDFRDITLKLVPPVFIPRPETEILVDIVLKALNLPNATEYNVLEIGCGSGAISLALAHSSEMLKCLAIDSNVHACDLAKENCDKLKLQERVTVIHATLQDDGMIKLADSSKTKEKIDFESMKFDCIVSNPPYVLTKDIPKLAPEIKIYEDLRALDGGPDGLKIIKPLLKYAAKTLKPNGRLFIEVDPSHPEYVKFFARKYPILGLKYEHTHKDFCNKERFVELLKTT